VRRVFQHAHAFVQSADEHVIFLDVGALDGFFQVTDAAMNDLGGGTGGGAGKIPRFAQHGADSAQLGVERAGGSGGSAADNTEIELLAGDVFQFFGSGLHGILSN
jgi:hypothetical protein